MYFWLIAGIVLIVLEITVSGFVLMLFGLACFASAGAAWLGVGVIGQMITFAAFSVVLGSFLPRLAKRFLQPPPDKELKTAVDALPGREGNVIQEVDEEATTGRVKIGGELWSARPAGEQTIPEGALVKVIRVEGSKAIVEQINSDPAPVGTEEEE